MKLRRTTCRQVRDLLPLHVGGDLDPRQAETVDEHLHRCLACFREYREFLNLRGRLGVLADEPLPSGVLDGFADEVMARIAVGEPGPAAELPGRTSTLHRITRYAAAAAVLFALGLGLASLNDLPPTQVPPGGRAPGGAVARAPAAPAPVNPSHPIGGELREGVSARPFGGTMALPVSAGALPVSAGNVFLFDSPDDLLHSADPVGVQPTPRLWRSRLLPDPDPNRKLRLR